MAPSNQDLVAPFDPTASVVISGAGLLQLTNGATPYADKGLNVVTTDIAGVPVVPDANGTTKWQTYTWVRRSATSVVAYLWNPAAANDATFQRWSTITLVSIADGSVTNSKIAAGAVTNDKIYSVDWSKLTNVPVGLMLAGVTAAGGDLTGLYPNPTIVANAVDSTKLKSDAAVDANRAVTTNHIQDKSVTAAKLADALTANVVIPPGAIMDFAGTVAPTGWLMCDGSLVLISNAPNLATAIYVGDGNNATGSLIWGYKADGGGSRNTAGLYIKLPDCRGLFSRGFDAGAGVDTGRTLQSTQADANKAHTHLLVNIDTGDANAGTLTNANQITKRATNASTSLEYSMQGSATAATVGLSASSGGTENRPLNLAFNRIIKI